MDILNLLLTLIVIDEYENLKVDLKLNHHI